MRLTLQQMIDSVLEGAQSGAMAKLAEEAKDEDKASQDEGEKRTQDKKALERKADTEEAQQGGGTPESSQEKAASLRVEKLASAVEEIVAYITGSPQPSNVGKIAAEDATAPNVGPGKGPGATPTNLTSPVPGEQSDVSGQAKTQIPNKPPMESGDNPKAAKNALQTNVDMQHPAQPEEGVMKQGSLAAFTAMLLRKTAADDDTPAPPAPSEFSPEDMQRIQQAADRRAAIGGMIGGGAGGAATGGTIGAGLGAGLGLFGHHVSGELLEPALSKVSPGAAEALGAMAEKGIGVGVADDAVRKALIRRGVGGGLIGGLGGLALGAGLGGLHGYLKGHNVIAPEVTRGAETGKTRALESMLTEGISSPTNIVGALGARSGARSEMEKIRQERGLDKGAALRKRAEDAINPAQISAPKSTTLPEDQPSVMARPAEVTKQERLIANNEAPADAQPVDAAAVPKKRMAEVLSEPMQTASTDRVLDEALGSSVVNQAGAKVASAQKVAAARAWIAKVASEGCKCGPNTGECAFCKVASRLGKGQKGSEKRGQFGTPPAGSGTSSPGGMLAGGNITPSM